jgi:hypothetical protein
MKFCCGSALEAQRAGTRAAANKKNGKLLRPRRETADARRRMEEGQARIPVEFGTT